MKTPWNVDLLKTIIKRDGCIINLSEYPKINQRKTIKFTCKCNTEHEKTFILLNKIGAFCKECTKIISQNKMKQTNLIKWGTENVLQNKEIQQKKKQTNLSKYGKEYPSQVTDFKEKYKRTMLQKYGVEHALQNRNIYNKMKNTLFNKYGTIYALQNKEIYNKMKQTMLNKYGVEHVMHNEELAEKTIKNAKKLKEFVYPDGTVIKVQGYEPYVIQKLLDSGYKQEDIITSRKEVPKLFYIKDEKKYRYYCDIHIKSEDKIIEVKSNYTYDLHQEINKLKADSAIELGYDFEFWIVNNNKRDHVIIKM